MEASYTEFVTLLPRVSSLLQIGLVHDHANCWPCLYLCVTVQQSMSLDTSILWCADIAWTLAMYGCKDLPWALTQKWVLSIHTARDTMVCALASTSSVQSSLIIVYNILFLLTQVDCTWAARAHTASFGKQNWWPTSSDTGSLYFCMMTIIRHLMQHGCTISTLH